MRCINKNSEEFKKLLEETGLKPQILSVKIINWQDKNKKIDEFPTKQEIIRFVAKNTISNEQREEAIKELEQQDKSKLSTKVDELFTIVRNEWGRLQYSKNKDIKNIFKNEFVGNEFKELYERLQSVVNKTDEGIDFERKVRSFAISLQEINNLTDKLQQKLRETDYSKMSDEDVLTELSKYSVFLNEWEQFLKSVKPEFLEAETTLSVLDAMLGNIDTTKNIIDSVKKPAVVNIYAKELQPTLLKQQELFEKEVAPLREKIKNALKRNDAEAAAKYQKRINEIEARYEKEKVDSVKVLSLINGFSGDASSVGGLIAYINSSDPITFVAQKRFSDLSDDVLQHVRKVELSFEDELKPLLEKLKASRFNVFNFNRQFVQEVKRKDKSGEYNQLELMNEFSGGWQLKLDEYLSAIDEAKQSGDEDALKVAKMELAKWKTKYMHQEFKPEVYQRYELWEDEIGKKAYQLRQEIFDEMNAISRKIRGDASEGFDLNEEEQALYENELYKLQRLGSLYNDLGEPKEGEEKKIAERIQEYNKKTKDIYEWKEKEGAFQRAYERFLEYADAVVANDPSEDKEEMINRWITNNTRFVIKPDWYTERKKILDKLNYLSKKIKDKQDADKVKEFAEHWDSIFDQIKGYRDADGEPIGTEISEEKTAKIKNELESIEKLKSSMEGLSGLSEEENQELSKYWEYIKNGVKLTTDQNNRKVFLENKRNSLGLTTSERNAFYDLINQLKEIQTKVPTSYYVNQLNVLTNRLGKSFDFVTAEELLSNPELDKLLEDEDFKNWFEKNHIKIKKWDVGKQQKIETWERLYTWNRILPTDEKYLETTELKDGRKVIGLPSLKYYYRDVRDKYKTEKIVGKTVDNKGQFLPKSYDGEGKLEAADDRYINKDYFNLKNSKDTYDVAKYKLLETYKKYLLQTQESLPYQDRLWYTIPSVRKHFSERVKSGDFKGIKSSIIERLNIFDRTSVDEEENNKTQPTDLDRKVVKADIYGNEILEIPIKYTGKLDASNVSLNIAHSIIEYTISSETKKALMEEQPIIKSLDDLLEANKTRDVNKIKIAVTKLTNVIKSKLGEPTVDLKEIPIIKRETSQRLVNIRNLEDRYLNGIYRRGIIFKNRTSFDQLVDTFVFDPIKRLGGFAVMATDFGGATTNQISGNAFSLIDSISERSFTAKDYAIATYQFGSKLLPAFMADLRQPLGKKSLYGQLFDLYDPQQELYKEMGHKFGTNSWLKAGEEAKQFFLNPRKFGELQMAASIMLATMNNKVVKTKDGSTIKLINAYEIGEDGYIKLKDNVDFSVTDFKFLKGQIRQVLRETQGNYAKADKTEFEKYSIGALLMYMRRFFVPLFLDAWQTRRFNGYGGTREGYNLTAFNVLFQGYKGIRDFGIKNVLFKGEGYVNKQDVKTLYKAMVFWSSTLVGLLLIAQIDPDEERRKYKKLKQWSFARLMALQQAIRVKQEIEQMTPIGGANDMIKMVKNPFMLGNKLSQMSQLSDYLRYDITGDTKGEYKKDYKKMMEELYGTDDKAIVGIYKLLGYRGGGVKSFIPGTEEANQAAAYRVKQTAVFADKNF